MGSYSRCYVLRITLFGLLFVHHPSILGEGDSPLERCARAILFAACEPLKPWNRAPVTLNHLGDHIEMGKS